jgi:BirA family biotin operon repressor/biotin-[acetyl-CoA-carboxylase] ligase
VQTLHRFTLDGFAPFLEEWRRRDALAGRWVTVSHPDCITQGEARGIDNDGALLLSTAEGVCRQVSGDVSVRMAGI